VAARKQKQRRMSAQVVEDEDYQLRYEVAAGGRSTMKWPHLLL
jgi:hypothetical protein